MKFLLGLVIGLLIVPIGIFFYLTAGSPPVATGDAPLPFEARLVHIPMHARIDREMVVDQSGSHLHGVFPGIKGTITVIGFRIGLFIELVGGKVHSGPEGSGTVG